MEIILKQDIDKVGNAGDVVTVKNGYATNYLIPQGFAILATTSAKKIHAENIRQRAHKEAKIREEAAALGQKIESVTLSVGAKTSTTGKIFGSINNIQIAEALAAKGYNIDRKHITIIGEDNVKEVGSYEAEIKLHRDVKVKVKFEVVAE